MICKDPPIDDTTVNATSSQFNPGFDEFLMHYLRQPTGVNAVQLYIHNYHTTKTHPVTRFTTSPNIEYDKYVLYQVEYDVNCKTVCIYRNNL